jgi:xanthosine utilization system XapX-like protein
MNFFKTLLNGLLGIVAIIVGYILINVGHALLVSFFAPDSWDAAKIVEVSGGLFVIIGIIKVCIKK